MAINRVQSDIISILVDCQTYIKTQDLSLKLKKHNLSPRTFQKEMKNLIETQHMAVSVQALKCIK